MLRRYLEIRTFITKRDVLDIVELMTEEEEEVQICTLYNKKIPSNWTRGLQNCKMNKLHSQMHVTYSMLYRTVILLVREDLQA